MYLILRYIIVSSRTLCTLSVALNLTDFINDNVPKCTDNFIVSARVRRPLIPIFVQCYVLYSPPEQAQKALTHSRLRMPQGSPGQGRGIPPGSISRGFDMFSRHP